MGLCWSLLYRRAMSSPRLLTARRFPISTLNIFSFCAVCRELANARALVRQRHVARDAWLQHGITAKSRTCLAISVGPLCQGVMAPRNRRLRQRAWQQPRHLFYEVICHGTRYLLYALHVNGFSLLFPSYSSTYVRRRQVACSLSVEMMGTYDFYRASTTTIATATPSPLFFPPVRSTQAGLLVYS